DGEGVAQRRSEYRRRIEIEIMRQVYNDGGDYEASTGYQVLVTQLLTTTLLLMRSEGVTPKPAFVERLRMMFRFLNTVASPFGELLFFAIPNGILGKGSHTHNDKLSFVLRVAGKEVLCDSGTGCYTRDITTRNHFRSTAAHNTLLIDDTEQNRIDQSPLGLFVL